MPPRSLPGLGLQGFWTLGEDNWKDAMDANLLKASFFASPVVKGYVSTLPTANLVDGDAYIINDTSTAHLSNRNNIALRDNGAWVFYAPTNGMRVGVAGCRATLLYQGSFPVAWRIASGAARVSAFLPGNGFVQGETLLSTSINDRLFWGAQWPAGGFTGVTGVESLLRPNTFSARVAGSTPSEFYLKEDGVRPLTITFAANSTIGVVTGNEIFGVNVGVITLEAGAVASGLSDIEITYNILLV